MSKGDKARKDALRKLLQDSTPDALEARRLRTNNASLSTRLRAALDREDKLRSELLFLLDIGAEPITPKAIRPKRKKSEREAVLVAVASDWHVGERVDKSEVHHRNEYTPKIAESRVHEFARGIAWILNLFRKGYTIDHLVLALLGDLITGYLHEDQLLSNTMTPTEETILCLRLVKDMITFIRKEFPDVKITLPCQHGNHGRIRQKYTSNRAAAHSYETMLYKILAGIYSEDDKVDFLIGEGPLSYQEIFGLTVRWTHGDGVKYQGGISGPGVPLRRKIGSWDKEQVADLTILGHLHSFQTGPDYLINGALVGYTPYARGKGYSYEPPSQTVFIVDKEWGWTMPRAVYVDKNYPPLHAKKDL